MNDVEATAEEWLTINWLHGSFIFLLIVTRHVPNRMTDMSEHLYQIVSVTAWPPLHKLRCVVSKILTTLKSRI
jgi:hypothetical protein